MTANNDALPPLPEPFGELERRGVWNGLPRSGFDDVFDADQMRDYARAAIRALSADRGEAVDYPVACNCPRDHRGQHIYICTNKAAPSPLVSDEVRVPLPEPLKLVHVYGDHGPTEREPVYELFDQDQLRAYGKQCRATPPSPAESAEGAVNGTWLWGKLMDWCKSQGASPANYDSLFAIANEAHKLNAAAPSGVSDADGKSALWALRQIMGDMRNCDNWDWLDPAVQKVANELVARNPYADLSQPQPGRVEGMDHG